MTASKMEPAISLPEVAGPGHGESELSCIPPMRVAMIVGDNETLHCGVKDGAHQLAEALARLGVVVDVMAPDSWAPDSVRKLLRHIRQGNYSVLHVQYPSIGYRGSLVPHLLGVFQRSCAVVASLHEFTAFSAPQRLSTQIFRWSADALMFGSEYERVAFNRRYGTVGAMQVLFPIVSQVPCVPSPDGRDATVVYFGQIRPCKGLEDYLALARLSLERGKPYRFHVVGSVSRSNETYARSLMDGGASAVQWSFDRTFEEVGAILGRSFAAYLPFPDGASERRGSLAAAWTNGLPVLSTLGPAITPAIREILIATEGAEQAMGALDDLAGHPQRWAEVSVAAQRYSRERTWERVAEIHASVYARLVSAFIG